MSLAHLSARASRFLDMSGGHGGQLEGAHDGVASRRSRGTATYGATKAAIHSFTESLREQLRDTSVRVIELAPPLTRTALMGSENNDRAMPLDEFLNETMALLAAQPDATQILVDRVKRQRYAEATGTYDEVFAQQSGRS